MALDEAYTTVKRFKSFCGFDVYIVSVVSQESLCLEPASPLPEYINNHGLTMELEQAVKILIQVASGMDELNQQGFIMVDLPLDLIFVTDRGQVNARHSD